MLPQKYRLTKPEEFENVFNKGKKQNCRFFVLFFAKNNLDLPRFAFLVSKKVSKSAVLRNRVKRMEREAVRKNLVFIKAGFDYVIMAKREALDIEKTAQISDEITKIFPKIK